MSENSEPDTFSISLISISSYNWNKLFLKSKIRMGTIYGTVPANNSNSTNKFKSSNTLSKGYEYKF